MENDQIQEVVVDRKTFKVHTVKCCREWIVLTISHVGKCGYCGQVPK